MPDTQLREVRQPKAHDSAIKQITGEARYIDDQREPAGLLHCYPGKASIASGKVVAMDLSAVAAAPGVVSLIKVADIPGKNDCSPIFGDDPIISEGQITFHGQVIFAVLAETRDQARWAAQLAKVEYEEEKAFISVEQANSNDSTVLPDYQMGRGDVVVDLAKASNRLQGHLEIGGQDHFYLEGHVSMVEPGEDGDMLVHCSTQHPTEAQHQVADCLGVPHHAVEVRIRRMGGGFGGKESQSGQWACLAAIGAKMTGHPVKIRLDRDDDMILTGKRHEFEASYDVGFDNQGRIEAIDLTLLGRCGHSADLSGAICDRAMMHSDNAYFLPSVAIHSRRLRTHTVSNTAFRGFGGPQGVLSIERVMDHIASSLGIDALEVRKVNLYGDEGRNTTPYEMEVFDNIAPELIEQLEASSNYQNRRAEVVEFNRKNKYLKKGLSLTPVKFGISFTATHMNQAGALVHVYGDGSIGLNHGGTEMGQGLYVKVAQVVADSFGIDLERVKITSTTTAKVPNTSPTAASSGADLNGMAAKIAADEIRGRLAEFAAGLFQASKDDVRFENNEVVVGTERLDFTDLVKKAIFARVSLSSTGYYKTPEIQWDVATGTGKPFFYFAYGAAVSEVTIDCFTGEYKVDRVDILHDVGHSLNPAIDKGQIEGGFIQGMGWLTTEELKWDDKGRLRTHAPSTYKIPTATDTPDVFNVDLFKGDGNRAETIYRSKAVGEPPLMLGIAVFSALTNAVVNATGRMPKLNAPATPEAVLLALRDGDYLV
jgi:xanthine dehydrogenase large subunit